MIKGKTPEEIRKLFNIQNDFSPEEEAQIRKENVSARILQRNPPSSCFSVTSHHLIFNADPCFVTPWTLPHEQEWAEDR